MRKKQLVNNKGFSLIELIVAVLIMAIIAGSAIVAFSSIFGTQVKGAAKTVQDALKQTRTDALGLENKTDTSEPNPASNGYETDVFAKFYVKDNELYVDVCTGSVDWTSQTDSSAKVLYSNKISSDSMKLEVYTVGSAESKIDTIGKDENNIAYLFFKKSTGGMSRLRIKHYNNTGAASASATTAGGVGLKLKVVSSADSQDVIVVNLTGRSYLDS